MGANRGYRESKGHALSSDMLDDSDTIARTRVEKEAAEVRKWLAEVSQAALNLERRWTWSALKRVAPQIASKLRDQHNLFDQACVTGSAEEVETHGAATCRGYAAAVRALEAADEPDDAYFFGFDPATGFRIAIGSSKAGAERVAELHGQSVVHVTPDEIAAILAGLEAFKRIDLIKRRFPGAEVIDLRPHDPAKMDSGVE